MALSSPTKSVPYRLPCGKIVILLKNLPFILREPQDERSSSSDHWMFFPFMLSLVEAFLGFLAESIVVSDPVDHPTDESSKRSSRSTAELVLSSVEGLGSSRLRSFPLAHCVGEGRVRAPCWFCCPSDQRITSVE